MFWGGDRGMRIALGGVCRCVCVCRGLGTGEGYKDCVGQCGFGGGERVTVYEQVAC